MVYLNKLLNVCKICDNPFIDQLHLLDEIGSGFLILKSYYTITYACFT